MKKLFSTNVSDNAFSFALLLFRLGVGGLMLANHGWEKLSHFAQKAQRFSDPFNIGSTTSLSLVVFAEFFCAAFIILGLFTRLAAIPLVIVMGVAFINVHNMNYGAGKNGGEAALVFLVSFVLLLIMGPGRLSLDRFVGK